MFASALSQVLGKPRVAAKRDFWFKHVSVDPVFWLHDAAPTGTSRASLSSWKLPVYPGVQGMECSSKQVQVPARLPFPARPVLGSWLCSFFQGGGLQSP